MCLYSAGPPGWLLAEGSSSAMIAPRTMDRIVKRSDKVHAGKIGWGNGGANAVPGGRKFQAGEVTLKS